MRRRSARRLRRRVRLLKGEKFVTRITLFLQREAQLALMLSLPLMDVTVVPAPPQTWTTFQSKSAGLSEAYLASACVLSAVSLHVDGAFKDTSSDKAGELRLRLRPTASGRGAAGRCPCLFRAALPLSDGAPVCGTPGDGAGTQKPRIIWAGGESHL